MSCGLQDLINLERLGRPTVLVHTDAFSEAAGLQAAMHGEPGLRRVSVPHPVQDKDASRIRAFSGEALGPILSALSAVDEGCSRQ